MTEPEKRTFVLGFSLPRRPSFDTSRYWQDSNPKVQVIAGIILDELRVRETITSDDVVEPVEVLYPGEDLRVVGHAFRKLRKEGLINPVSLENSARPRGHHHLHTRWQLTEKGKAVLTDG